METLIGSQKAKEKHRGLQCWPTLLVSHATIQDVGPAHSRRQKRGGGATCLRGEVTQGSADGDVSRTK